jgi:hypothetical protein
MGDLTITQLRVDSVILLYQCINTVYLIDL